MAGMTRIDRKEYEQRLDDLRHVVGDTPLLAIDVALDGRRRRIFAKLESTNLTGSIKDRMALHVIRSAYERGRLAPGATIAEATSGNTGISFAAIGRALGHPVTIFMPDWMSAERAALMRSLGADIRLVSREEDGFLGCLRLMRDFGAEDGTCYLPDQFGNADNIAAHERTTGVELWWQLRMLGLEPSAFVAGVGTGGTVMGVGRYLRGQDASVKVHPVEPSNSPTFSTGEKQVHGSHRIQGISDDFVPPICDLGELDEVLSVDDGDSIIMAQRLARELGLGVGISSGANLLAAIMTSECMGADAVVATVFPDDNKKYLSTSLLAEEPHRADHLNQRVSLLGFRSVKRTCATCCDGEACDRLLPYREDRTGSAACPLRRTGA